MKPKTIALFEGQKETSDTIVGYLTLHNIGLKVLTAATWNDAHAIVATGRREHINLYLVDAESLLPHKNHINRAKGLLHAIHGLHIVPPPVVIEIGHESLGRQDERLHFDMFAAPFPTAIAFAINQARDA